MQIISQSKLSDYTPELVQKKRRNCGLCCQFGQGGSQEERLQRKHGQQSHQREQLKFKARLTQKQRQD